jgi:prepilin-type N-terminal cleavage/methylation domain-containing protein
MHHAGDVFSMTVSRILHAFFRLSVKGLEVLSFPFDFSNDPVVSKVRMPSLTQQLPAAPLFGTRKGCLLMILNRKNGFSMVELLIVISIIGCLAAVSIPLFLDQKDKAIIAVTHANLDAARSGLTRSTIHSTSNQYPAGRMNYFDFLAAVPESNLPPLETEAMIITGSFIYSSDGTTYILHAASTNRTGIRFLVSPAGVVYD